jgi:hypothetical protein
MSAFERKVDISKPLSVAGSIRPALSALPISGNDIASASPRNPCGGGETPDRLDRLNT